MSLSDCSKDASCICCAPIYRPTYVFVLLFFSIFFSDLFTYLHVPGRQHGHGSLADDGLAMMYFQVYASNGWASLSSSSTRTREIPRNPTLPISCPPTGCSHVRICNSVSEGSPPDEGWMGQGILPAAPDICAFTQRAAATRAQISDTCVVTEFGDQSAPVRGLHRQAVYLAAGSLPCSHTPRGRLLWRLSPLRLCASSSSPTVFDPLPAYLDPYLAQGLQSLLLSRRFPLWRTSVLSYLYAPFPVTGSLAPGRHGHPVLPLRPWGDAQVGRG
jgi:hypothetical protein